MATQIVLQGDVLDVLKSIDDEFFDCIITSPPYWGLRDYGLEPQIWDGDELCEHEWDGAERWLHRGTTKSKLSHVHTAQITEQKVVDNFCIHCNAWRGSLGLEPTFNDVEVEIELMELRNDLTESEREYVIEELSKCGL